MKSGISNRLSPAPRENERTFHTFRGDSPSVFDSDTDTLSKRPVMSTPRRQAENPRFEPVTPGFMDPADPSTPRRQLYPPTTQQNVAGIHPQNLNATYNNVGDSGSLTRQPIRVAPLTSFNTAAPPQPGSINRLDSETDQSDAESCHSSLSRRNHVPRLPYYPGIEYSQQAYAGPNRTSGGGFSERSSVTDTPYTPSASQIDPNYSFTNVSGNYSDSSGPTSGNYNAPASGNFNYNLPTPAAPTTNYNNHNPNPPWLQNVLPDGRFPPEYGGNIVSELEDSRPVSMDDSDLLLPPYPEVLEEDDEEENLSLRPGYTGLSPRKGDQERAVLYHKSKYESSA